MSQNASNTSVGAKTLADVFSGKKEAGKFDDKISDRMSVMQPSAVREIFKFLGDSSVISFAAAVVKNESFKGCFAKRRQVPPVWHNRGLCPSPRAYFGENWPQVRRRG